MFPIDILAYIGWVIVAIIILLCFIPSKSKKTWRVGNHTVYRKTKTDRHAHGYNIHKERTYYVCAQCDKTSKKRKGFYDKKCYEAVDG